MNEMLIAELTRVRQTAYLREAANERLVRKPEPEATPGAGRDRFGRLLAACTSWVTPRAARPVAS